jgi:hypothetical protein
MRKRRALRIFGPVYAAIVVIPPLFAAGLRRDAASWIAWAIISVYLTGFVAIVVAIFTEKDTRVREAKPAERRMSWRSGLAISAGVWLFIAPGSTAIMLGDKGFSTFTDSAYYWALGLFAVVMLIVGQLVRLGEVTKEDVSAKVAKRRRLRDGRPGDSELLDAAGPRERATALKTVRRRATRQAAIRRIIAIPLAPIAVVLAVRELQFLPDLVTVPLSLAALALLIGIAFTALRRDPLVLFGRVTKGLYGVETVGGATPGLSDALFSFVTNGSFRTVTVEAQAAFRLTRAGDLSPDDAWRGVHEVGATHRVFTRSIEGEDAVLVCAANGLVIGQYGDLVRSPANVSRPGSA